DTCPTHPSSTPSHTSPTISPAVLCLALLHISSRRLKLLISVFVTSAKIRAIEAKLQMMEENPDDSFSGPSAYVYNKPPERKRWEPYPKSHHSNQSRPFRKFRR
ncbi:hypothetical protein AMECASPLE_003604, partial [Ameca splendens]